MIENSVYRAVKNFSSQSFGTRPKLLKHLTTSFDSSIIEVYKEIIRIFQTAWLSKGDS